MTVATKSVHAPGNSHGMGCFVGQRREAGASEAYIELPGSFWTLRKRWVRRRLFEYFRRPDVQAASAVAIGYTHRDGTRRRKWISGTPPYRQIWKDGVIVRTLWADPARQAEWDRETGESR